MRRTKRSPAQPPHEFASAPSHSQRHPDQHGRRCRRSARLGRARRWWKNRRHRAAHRRAACRDGGRRRNDSAARLRGHASPHLAMPASQLRRGLEPGPVPGGRARRHGRCLHRRRHVHRQLLRRAGSARLGHHHPVRLVAQQQLSRARGRGRLGALRRRHPGCLRLWQREPRMDADQQAPHQLR